MLGCAVRAVGALPLARAVSALRMSGADAAAPCSAALHGGLCAVLCMACKQDWRPHPSHAGGWGGSPCAQAPERGAQAPVLLRAQVQYGTATGAYSMTATGTGRSYIQARCSALKLPGFGLAELPARVRRAQPSQCAPLELDVRRGGRHASAPPPWQSTASAQSRPAARGARVPTRRALRADVPVQRPDLLLPDLPPRARHGHPLRPDVRPAT